MAKTKPVAAPTPPVEPTPSPTEYTVVARRYRPQQFAELIGQEHVAGALVNALQSGRVAHAYLFTGARGVGKTSAARILAKALNCVTGPTATPCDQCDSCKATADGQDVDVVEIDGASNGRIDEARDLRQNIGFRPTRSRYKVYIIDEVHMLTTQAFNALLKTLEEPPPHVKFIFATTEVQKIPITILSRCQRFDFAHVGPAKILDQLKAIVAREGHEADEDALRLVARRAAGSMRDSQSLLDQLLASANGRLTAEHVNAVLGTAGDERVAELATAILAHDATTALNLIGQWIERGLQIGELVDQLVDYWRTLMLLSCGPELRDLPVTRNRREVLCQQAGKLTLDTILAGLDVWTAAKARMRGSSHTQVLLEMAAVRLCRIEELLSVGQLAQTLTQSGTGPASNGIIRSPTPMPGRTGETVDPSKKNSMMGGNGLANRESAHTTSSTLQLTEATVQEIWGRLIRQVTDKSPILATHLKAASLPAIFGPNSLVIRFHPSYNHECEACGTDPNRSRIEAALQKITGHPVTIKAELGGGPTPAAKPRAETAPLGRRQQLMELPLFQKAAAVLGAVITHADESFSPSVVKPAPPPTTAADDEPEDSPPTDTDPDES